MLSTALADGVSPTDGRIDLEPGEAWLLVRARRLGSLHFDSGRGPRALVVPYATTDAAVVIELPAFNDALPYVESGEVTVEVSDHDDEGHEWSVEVTGTILPISSEHDDAKGSELIHPWPRTVASHRFLILSDHVRGRISCDVALPARSCHRGGRR